MIPPPSLASSSPPPRSATKQTTGGKRARYHSIRQSIFDRYIRTASEIGEKLPSARELADEFSANIETVSKSLTALAMEGWLERRAGSGTYISKLETERQLVGVYLGSPPFSYSHPDMRFYACIDQLVQQALHARGSGYLHYADSRIRECWTTPHPALFADAQAGKISSLIVIRASFSNYAWIEKLPVNLIGLGVNYGYSSVLFDLGVFASNCVDYLYQTGCRKIGMITTVPPKHVPRVPVHFCMHDSFHGRLADHGLVSKPHWVEAADEDGTETDFAVVDPQLFGYRSFQRIWQSKDRPDGLVIFSDIAGLGAVQAAADLGVNFNRDIKVVFSSNLENLWPQLMPYPRMVFSEREIARALLNIAERDTCEHLHIRPFLLPMGHGGTAANPFASI
ncbi:transcriptional regulator [Opitutaceae bacterium TAV1]|nr:transcriptional regulator [Opitutaceae bacterium TAV1]